jgi:hypothetical protein
MSAIVADTRRNGAKSPVPATGHLPVAIDDISRGRFLRLMQTVTLTLMTLGTFLVSGIATPSLPGVATAVRSAGVTVAAPATSSLAARRLGECPPTSGPCP